jgi:hypothetical protein
MIIELGKRTGHKNFQIILDLEMNHPAVNGRDIKGERKRWNEVPHFKLRGKHIEASFMVLACGEMDRMRH